MAGAGSAVTFVLDGKCFLSSFTQTVVSGSISDSTYWPGQEQQPQSLWARSGRARPEREQEQEQVRQAYLPSS